MCHAANKFASLLWWEGENGAQGRNAPTRKGCFWPGAHRKKSLEMIQGRFALGMGCREALKERGLSVCAGCEAVSAGPKANLIKASHTGETEKIRSLSR